MSDFKMKTMFGKSFAQVHTVSVKGTNLIDSIHDFLSKTLSQDCPHDEIAFSSAVGPRFKQPLLVRISLIHGF